MPATAISTNKVYPVDEMDRYVLTVRWAASNNSDALTVKIRWWNAARDTSSDVTIFSKAVNVAHTWQTDVNLVVPPNAARYMQILVSKPNVTTKFAIAKINLKPFDNGLLQKTNSIDFFEDFFTAAGTHGWSTSNIGAVATATVGTPTNTFGNWSESGIVNLSTNTTSGNGGTHNVVAAVTGEPPLGAEWVIKCALSSSTNRTAWAGLWSNTTTEPDTALANTVYGIGIRTHNTGAASNWFGICRNGTTETTVDLGVTGDTTIRLMGWVKTSTGIQFTLRGRPVGSVVTTNIPSTSRTLGPLIGIITRTSASKTFACDFFGYQAFQTRYV